MLKRSSVSNLINLSYLIKRSYPQLLSLSYNFTLRKRPVAAHRPKL